MRCYNCGKEFRKGDLIFEIPFNIKNINGVLCEECYNKIVLGGL